MRSPQASLDERVSAALRHAPHLTGHHLRSRTRNGHVVLHGAVNTFFQKQMAQETIRRIDGVHRIANELVVLGEPLEAPRAPHF
jgi:osmotically-inducible protein OsmY